MEHRFHYDTVIQDMTVCFLNIVTASLVLCLVLRAMHYAVWLALCFTVAWDSNSILWLNDAVHFLVCITLLRSEWFFPGLIHSSKVALAL